MPDQPAIYISEPTEWLRTRVVAACRAHGVEPVISLTLIDSSRYLHDEAELLDASELTDAEAALVEDGIFADPAWLEEHPMASGGREQLSRAATKYGWAIAHVEQVAAADSGNPKVWSVAQGSTATTRFELDFILAELTRRRVPVTHLSPCWPVPLEPAADLEEHAPIFLRRLAEFAPSVKASGIGFFVRSAADKTSLLPEIAGQLGPDALLDFALLGVLAAARLVARTDGALFRRMLLSAQEHFAFDRSAFELSTTEEDVHALPDVEDCDLERLFLDDLRGRQLLLATAGSTFGEAALQSELEALLHRQSAELDALIAERIQRHLAMLGSWGAT